MDASTPDLMEDIPLTKRPAGNIGEQRLVRSADQIPEAATAIERDVCTLHPRDGRNQGVRAAARNT